MTVARLTKYFQWLALFLLVSVSEVFAQRNVPHIGYVYPAGGQVGTAFDATVGGQYLTDITNAFVSGVGVQVAVIPYEPIISGKEAKDLRERMQELRKAEKSADKIKELREIRRKLVAFEKKRLAPALADSVPIRITIAPNATIGNHELRLGGYNGLSNPLMFQVSQLPEFREAESLFDDEPPLLRIKELRKTGQATPGTTNVLMRTVTLPATLNGQILPGGANRYQFKGRQGQQLVVAVSARELIPYLADAVPGWFQAKVVLYDSQGKEITYDDHYWFHPDPVLFYTIPKEGEYILEIKDSLYRGREDFIYRIAIGELPFIANVFPLGGQVGKQTTVAIWGWNLPMNKHTLDLSSVEPGLYPFFVRNKTQISNRIPFMVDTLPECLKKSPSDSPTNAQVVTLPIIINGRIEQPGDVDVFRFEGHAGQQIVAEIFARRLDSPLDSVLKLTDATGKQLAFNDDHEDKGFGLNTHHADSYLTATLPSTGTYYIYLWDAQQKGGWAYGYRLRLSAPRPDFELRAVPSSLSVRPGGSVPINVFALRRDGFTNDIKVVLANAPEGFRLSSGSLVSTQEQVKLTLTASWKAPKGCTNLVLEGHARFQDREIVHRAVPADDMMQAFLYRHLVPASELKVLVATAPPPKTQKTGATTSAPTKAPAVKLPAGGSVQTQIKIPTTTYVGKLRLELEEPPEGITIKSFTVTRDGAEAVLQSNASKVKVGQKGQLTVNAYAERTQTTGQSNKSRTSLGAILPIPFEIVSPPAPQK